MKEVFSDEELRRLVFSVDVQEVLEDTESLYCDDDRAISTQNNDLKILEWAYFFDGRMCALYPVVWDFIDRRLAEQYEAAVKRVLHRAWKRRIASLKEAQK